MVHNTNRSRTFRCCHFQRVRIEEKQNFLYYVIDWPLCYFYFSEQVICHKTFHRYVVRAKRGTVQSQHDAKSHARSAGANIRRHHEAAFKDVIILFYFFNKKKKLNFIIFRSIFFCYFYFSTKKKDIRLLLCSEWRSELDKCKRIF
jgi:hypothetical protein